MSTKILATGSYVPEFVVTNKDFEQIMETSDAWIKERTGIQTRRFEDVSNVRMATEAAKNALEFIDIDSIDCIVVGTYTPDTHIPGTASEVRKALGITRPIPAFDVNAACSGFLYALHVGHAYITANLFKRVLVIGSDFNSRVLNFEDRSSSILFGDGAGAVVIEKGIGGIQDIRIGGLNDRYESLVLKSNTDFQSPFLDRDTRNHELFKMKGADVFKFAVGILEKSVKELLELNHLALEDVDYLIAHQANQRILDTASKSLNIDPNKVLSNVKDYGNTSSGSVPLLLDEANRKGLLKTGMKLVIVAFGGGLTYGSALIEW